MTAGAHPHGGRANGWWAAVALLAGAAAGAAAAVIPNPALLIAGALALGIAVVVVTRPEAALLGMALFAGLNLARVATDFHGAPSLFQPYLLLVGAGLALRWMMTGERPHGGGRALLMSGAFLLVAAGSLLVAGDAAAGRTELQILAKDVAVAVLAGLLLHRASSLRKVIWALVACGAVLGTISVFQYVTGSFGNSFLGFGQSAVQNIVGGTDDIRISGPLDDPNFYAQWLVMLLPLALDRMWNEPHRRLRITAGYSAAVLVAAGVLTFSRGGALALAAVLVLMLVKHPPRVRTVIGMGLAALLVVPMLPQGYVERLTTLGQIGTVDGTTDGSIRARTAETAASVEMFADHPLLGVGYGNYLARYSGYVRDTGVEQRNKDREAHNLYLEVAAETGVIGLGAFALLIGGAFLSLRAARNRFRAAGLPGEAGLAYALMVALAGYLITSVFLHMDYARLIWLLLGVAFALPAVAAREDAALRTEAGAAV
jgi:hypothetical protein